ncbi:hypothetical protein OJ252_3595 [Cryptosporidium canis]|uniref:Uncharacterized protein n=1 Tax=Cryptosporidium canis TaxID=195482 RepID=A0ABQ8P1V8_9CRYT|nr:hypothetical protein OJ252_3595 [Cryptosporidium canis]
MALHDNYSEAVNLFQSIGVYDMALGSDTRADFGGAAASERDLHAQPKQGAARAGDEQYEVPGEDSGAGESGEEAPPAVPHAPFPGVREQPHQVEANFKAIQETAGAVRASANNRASGEPEGHHNCRHEISPARQPGGHEADSGETGDEHQARGPEDLPVHLWTPV